MHYKDVWEGQFRMIKKVDPYIQASIYGDSERLSSFCRLSHRRRVDKGNRESQLRFQRHPDSSIYRAQTRGPLSTAITRASSTAVRGPFQHAEQCRPAHVKGLQPAAPTARDKAQNGA